jgi:hypothetical protein
MLKLDPYIVRVLAHSIDKGRSGVILGRPVFKDASLTHQWQPQKTRTLKRVHGMLIPRALIFNWELSGYNFDSGEI